LISADRGGTHAPRLFLALWQKARSAMKAIINGEVVDTDRNDWNMNGKSGTAYAIFIRSGGARDSAQRVRVSAEQYGAFSIGDDVELPVGIFANVNDYGTAKLSVTLDPEFTYIRSSANGHSVGASLNL
jgi:hypothetical protein